MDGLEIGIDERYLSLENQPEMNVRIGFTIMREKLEPTHSE